jgi:drug/metabolite transporter (DMT)-like permease
LFWCLAPFLVDMTHADLGAAVLFACVGLFFPATVALLNFESNRLMGPSIAGAVSATAPVFAVLLAVILLGERLRLFQILGIAAIAGGVMLMYRGDRRPHAPWSLWMLALPAAAAAIRGAVQPIIKLGLERWSDPIVAVVIGYTISSVVLVSAASVHNGGFARHFSHRGALWFAAVGICNGLAVLSMYAAWPRSRRSRFASGRQLPSRHGSAQWRIAQRGTRKPTACGRRGRYSRRRRSTSRGLTSRHPTASQQLL